MKKAFLLLGIISLSLLAISPCWSSGQQAEPTAIEVPAEPSEINILLMASATGTGLKDMLADFESKHPLIKVKELTYSPAAGYDTKVELELAAGGGAYDVIWATGRSYSRWALNDWIVEIGPII